MAKIKDAPREQHSVVKVSTGSKKKATQGHKWWKAKSQAEMCSQLLDTASYLKEQQQFRYRQTAVFARLYGNMPLYNFIGSNMSKMNAANTLPLDRPTMNVVQSCTDTLNSRISQSRPRPIFLTDNSNYKERTLAKQLNNFMAGELYQTKAYEQGPIILRDAAVLGTGVLKILKRDNKVSLERRLLTELLVDHNDAWMGDPRQMYEFKLVDREVLADMIPSEKSAIAQAEQAYPDASGDSEKTVSDQVMIVEGWHLPSGKDSGDGMHAIACSSGLLMKQEYKKDKFPFVFLHYSPRVLGFWGQGLAEQLMGTQVEINKLLMTISSSINLVGVPRVFVEDGSKVVKAHLNNQVGAIVTYRGTKPSYEVAPCMPQEVYAQLQRLVEYAYQQSGVSALSASAVKPAGLNSGEAIRNYNDLQSDRFASLVKRYDNLFVDLAYQIIDQAVDIADETGEYQTIYPGKDGTRKVDLPEIKKLTEDPFVIQCFDASSLPRDPAGRLQKVTEMMQASLISPDEGRRLLDYPDIEQVDKLANASEERILKYLDDIIDDGKYTPPDVFMNLQLAEKLVGQYYNLYQAANLEEEKSEMLRTFFTQIQALKAAATPPPAPEMPGGAPQAVPQARPQSDVLPNAPTQ